MGFKVSTKECPWILAKMGSWFKSDLSEIMGMWNVDYQFVNTESRDVLGIEYSIPMEQTFKDMVNSMMDTGVL
jgi:hypothetical protein